MNKIKDCTVRLETKADYDAVENLTREAFWNIYRPGCLEHYLIHILRDSDIFVPELDFVMEKDGDEFDKKFPPKEKLKLPGQLV